MQKMIQSLFYFPWSIRTWLKKKKKEQKKKKQQKKPQNQIQNKKKGKLPQKKHYKQALLANAEAMQSAFYGFSYNYLLRITINCNSGTLFYHELT